MNKKLPKGAYGGVSGKDYVPYITDKSKTGGNIAVLIIGLILASVFAASADTSVIPIQNRLNQNIPEPSYRTNPSISHSLTPWKNHPGSLIHNPASSSKVHP